MKNKAVKVFAPASIANIGAGFDVLGVALQKPGDIVIAKRNNTHTFNFSVKTTIENVPTAVDDNLAAFVAINMIKELKPNFGVDLELHKLMPIGSGLGSSAASCVAAAVAVNALLSKPLTKLDLLPFVIEGERKTSGSAHADNVAASLLGRGCIVRDNNPADIVPFGVHRSLTWVVVRPHYSIKTEEARRILPGTLPLSQVIQQLGNISGLIIGLTEGNSKIIKKSLIDHIAEPVRQKLIPGYSEMKQAALAAGAIGCAISGSGPAMFAIIKSKSIARKVAYTMQKALKEATGLSSDIYVSATNVVGAKILQENFR